MNNPFEEILAEIKSLKELLANGQKVEPGKAAEIIDTKELCARLNISEPTAIAFRKRKKIPFFTIGSSIRYNWIKVIEALEKSR